MITAKDLSKKILKALPELNKTYNIKDLTVKDVKKFELRIREIKSEVVELSRLYDALVFKVQRSDKSLMETLNSDRLGQNRSGYYRNRGDVYAKELRNKISELSKERYELAHRLKSHYK